MLKELLTPGTRFKRWVLLIGIGMVCLITFFILTLGAELHAVMRIFEQQVNAFFNLRPEQYNMKLTVELILFIIGSVCTLFGTFHLWKFLINTFVPEKKGKLSHVLFKESNLSKAPHVVVLGGGTGLNSLLSGLKNHTNNITAVVGVADEGSNSRTLRTEFGILPPGDIRNCLVALSDSGPLMAKLLQYRFKEGSLKGHSFGNLLITALTRVTGSFEKAVRETGNILAIRGKVIPVSLDNTHLCAELENGKVIKEEPLVEVHKTKFKSEIKRLFLEPESRVTPEVVKAIKQADLIVLGPGSLYTSVLPHMLVKGVPKTIKASKAKKVYVCNVMTQPGETDNYNAFQHVEKVVAYLGKDILDAVIVNKEKAPQELYERYKQEGAERVTVDPSRIEQELEVKVVSADLMTQQNLLRHDSEKLAKAVLSVVK
jgi:uncharacterized cofD-like protein